EIEDLLKYAEAWSTKDDKLGAHLAAYICVTFLGVLEDCIENLIKERANKSKDPEILNFISSIVHQRFKNPDRSAICEILGLFSKEYRDKFSRIIKAHGPEKEALDNIVGNKNSLAHEGTSKLNLSVKDMNDYYKRVIPVIEAIEEVLS
ncbi:MAG TPA: HEPN domain-containing protein, partial [Dehalococcoidales bacterium]|nr:HEPN domain-containing protein [Dehalococcoidales bacterium]